MILLYILLILYIVRTIKTILYHLAWWEIKEYRIDRMLVHIRETKQGKRWVLNPLTVIKWAILIGILLSPQTFLMFAIWFVVLSILYAAEGIKAVVDIKVGWKHPPARKRVVGIGLVSGILLGGIFLLTPANILVVLLVVDKFIGPVITSLIILSNRVFDIHRHRTMNRARARIAKQKDLRVIGVTGSYGKTTTKDIIAHILGTQFNVVKTIKSQNADIGIAERILSEDLTGVDYFVCETAAYHPGEIASSCSLFGDKIQVGVITGINEQHQSLFGSIDITRKSKYELIKAVRNNGIALFNAADKRVKPMVAWAKKRADVKTILVTPTIPKTYPVNVPAEPLKENVALAIAVAKSAGMSIKDIKTALKTFEFPEKTMTHENYGTVLLVNDTFNASPDAVYTALDEMKHYKGRKRLVLQPLIELGSYADAIHEKIGATAAKICDEIILTNSNWSEAFMKGVDTVKKSNTQVRIGSSFPMIDEGVIVCEGKEAENYVRSYRLTLSIKSSI